MNQLIYLFILLVGLTGCENVSDDYFPLGRDYRWEYVIEEQVNAEREVLKSIVANLKRRTVGGLEYFPRRDASGKTYYFYKSGQGIIVSPRPGQPGRIILGFPMQVGTAWQREVGIDILRRRHESFSGGESFISLDDKIVLDFSIASLEDTIEVPAGRFTQCMRVEGKGTVTVDARTRGIDHILIEQTEWYARGVGLVKQVRTEKSMPEKYQGEQIQQLVSLRH